jgi:hypothetical protein
MRKRQPMTKRKFVEQFEARTGETFEDMYEYDVESITLSIVASIPNLLSRRGGLTSGVWSTPSTAPRT